jgi:hypothetical protein
MWQFKKMNDREKVAVNDCKVAADEPKVTVENDTLFSVPCKRDRNSRYLFFDR